MDIHVVLVEPEIPQNTGNIARTCAAVGATLHLVEPLGFSVRDRYLKRAGLDYWHLLDVVYHDNLDSFLADHRDMPLTYVSKKVKQLYSDYAYPSPCYLLFGKETEGLPEPLIFENLNNSIRIPMVKQARSLNLSNAVAIVVYEALRRAGFPHTEE